MDYCDFELEDALTLLYTKYFRIQPLEKEEEHIFSEKELLEQRQDEKAVLDSIYDDTFHEKVLNSVWILNFRLDYIVQNYCTKREPKKLVNNVKHTKKKEKCRWFLQGNCKYGAKCRFTHEEDAPPKNDIKDEHLNDYKFELEVRFPPNSKYPFEPPIIFVKTNAILPPLLNLHITRKLYQEAKNLAKDGIPCVYSIAEMLKNEEEIIDFIQNVPMNFLLPNDKLFPTENEVKEVKVRPSHYRRGTTNRDNKKVLSEEELRVEDKKIVDRHMSKGKDPKYNKMCRIRENLPAHSLKNNILNKVKMSQIVVISGETGCGKSTQVPQFILDDWMNNFDEYNGRHVEVICTQPRRISAIGVAERVADERAEKVGNTVGYQIRLESKMSSSTRLTFCTTGILLRRLEIDPMLSSVSHVIVDEVHERSEER